jgi:Zn-dependent M28 family amino/carboxypeptidase
MIGITEETQQLEKRAREEVSPENLKAHIDYLCSLGEKLAGTEDEAKACQYIADRLTEIGLKATVHEFESYISHPVSAGFSTYFPEKIDVEGVGVSFGLSTPEQGFSAEVISVGSGTEAEYAGKCVEGKIVLVDKLPSPERAVTAVAHGAAAMVAMSEGHMRHKMIVTPVWGTPGLDEKDKIPRIPVVSISGDDGAQLRELAQAGTLKGTVKTVNREGWMTVRLPVTEIKGSRPGYLLVGGHYCSWFDGGTDNVTGNSCLIELARILKQYEGSLKYGVRIAWWPGHSNGRYSGSTWYADAFWQDIYDNGIVYFNIDSPGVKGASVYVPRHQMGEVSEFNEGCVAELTDWSTVTSPEAQLALGRRTGRHVNSTRPSRAADQSFWGIGLTSIGVYSMLPPDHPDRRKEVGGSGGAWWWHSIDDTADKTDVDVLSQDTRLYISIILRLATATTLPFNFEVVAQDYIDALQEYRDEAGGYLPLDRLLERAAMFKEKARTLKAHAERFEGDAADKMNRFYLKLARTLNPTLYTSVSKFQQQPALGTRLVPDLALTLQLKSMDPNSNDFKFLKAGMIRAVNKVDFHLLEAIRLIDQVIG